MEKATFPESRLDLAKDTTCKHCNTQCEPVELEEEDYHQIDMLGPESLPEVKQAVWEGLVICEHCYYKEL